MPMSQNSDDRGNLLDLDFGAEDLSVLDDYISSASTAGSNSTDSNEPITQTGIETQTAAGSSASETPNIIRGNDGRNWLSGTDGPDRIYGYGGADTLYGNGGDDVMYGGAGDDVLAGGDGDDTLYGGSGDDRMWGNAGSDVMYGGDGDDVMYGGFSDDDDKLYGGAGNDELRGEGGNNYLDGGDGNDVLWSGWGDDVLKGGAGDDTFVYYDGLVGNDVILDFETSGDTIELNYLGVSSFAELQGCFEQKGDDLVIDFGDGNSITLKGINQDDLTADDFKFTTTNDSSQTEPAQDDFLL